MAKNNGNGTVTVQKGDTLWGITKAYVSPYTGANYQQVANWNGIKNPNLIYVGQVIKITASSGSSGSTTSSTTQPRVNVHSFGPLSTDDTKMYAAWSWSKRSETDSYQIAWEYQLSNGVWFVGENIKIPVDHNYYYASESDLYDIPKDAIAVRFCIKPISKTKKDSKGNETNLWNIGWTNWKTYTITKLFDTPEAPSKVDIDENNKLTVTLENLDKDEFTHVQFEIVQNDTTSLVISSSLAINNYGYVSYSYNVSHGNNYKVRYKAIKGKLTSDWSPFSPSIQSKPSTPSGITTCKGSEKGVDDKYTVYLEWGSVKSADTYDIQYTTIKEYFDAANGQTNTVSTEDSSTSITIVQLEPGEHFFRVRAKNEKGVSDWTDIVSVKMGEPPGAPTTWESTTRAIVGEPLKLYWVHNAADGSTQTWALLYLSTDGGLTSTSYEIKNDGYYGIDSHGNKYLIKSFADDEEKDQTSVCEIDTTLYDEGAKLTWWVCTAGITNSFGKESVYRSIDIYTKPSLDLLVTDKFSISENGEITLITPENGTMDILESFPFYIKAWTNNTTQTPIGYSLSITANSSYETVDQVGNDKIVSAGDEVYSKYFDTSEVLVVEISANNIDLENGVEYSIACTVSMDSGLTATAYSTFSVSWTDVQYTPNAEITIDTDTYTASIRPYCEDRTVIYKQVDLSSKVYSMMENTLEPSTLDYAYTSTFERVHLGANSKGVETYYCTVYVDSSGNPYETPMYYKVTLGSGEYTKTSTSLNASSIFNVYTNTGEQVLLGMVDGANIYYCESEDVAIVEDVTLAVYRREFDGAFTEIASNISNINNTFVTDPHPALDYARYRIVAKTISTGAISYYDLPGYPVGCSSIIIQWDEDWSSFNNWNEDSLSEPSWAGSLLKLPYNVDESDSTNPDITMVKYIGRKRPVTYYGTQLGETASWSSTVPKNDTETIYALRRLAVWCGDVYVRSPSGVGYWAHVKPSFSLKHRDVTVPVSLDITRVEGGI